MSAACGNFAVASIVNYQLRDPLLSLLVLCVYSVVDLMLPLLLLLRVDLLLQLLEDLVGRVSGQCGGKDPASPEERVTDVFV